MKSNITRRNFLKTSAGVAAAAYLGPTSLTAAEQKRSIGANDRIRIGIIGCGGRGREAHMKGIYNHVKATNFEIVALADPWRVAREQANAMVKEWFGRDAQQFVSYRDLLQVKDLDAVMIASPDHCHTTHLEAAALAGKHTYVEKPMAIDMRGLLKAYDAVKRAGIVVQVGTQIRSLPGIAGARQVYQTGILGKVARIEECRNGEEPYWYNHAKDVKREDLAWDEFTMGRTSRPFDPRRYSSWYGYYEFSQGPVPQWGTHFLDLVHYVTGIGFPASCVCQGGIFTFKDENAFTVPDHVQALWVYPEGLMVSYSTNFGNGSGNSRKIFGDKGLMNLANWNAPFYTAEGGAKRDGTIRGKNEVVPVERPDHFLDWLQCLRSGGVPNASIEAGYQHSVASIMAVRSYETGRRMVYDHARREIVPG